MKNEVKLINPFKHREVGYGKYEQIEGFYYPNTDTPIMSFGKYSIWLYWSSYLYCYENLVFNELVGYNEEYLKEVALRQRTEKNQFLYDGAIRIINKYYKPNLEKI